MYSSTSDKLVMSNQSSTLKTIIASPLLTILMALVLMYASNSTGIAVYKLGLGYTALMLVLGYIGTKLGINFGKTMKSNDVSLEFAMYLYNSLLFVSPCTVSLYKIIYFWSTLIIASGIRSIFCA